jgi:hypothetical protein
MNESVVDPGPVLALGVWGLVGTGLGCLVPSLEILAGLLPPIVFFGKVLLKILLSFIIDYCR